MFSTSFLFASLIWSSVGFGYFIYGKKQRSWPPMCGGVGLMAISYFVVSALIMSSLAVGIMIAVYYAVKNGF